MEEGGIRRVWGRLLAVVAASAALCLVVAACGSDDGGPDVDSADRDAVEQAVRAVQRSFEAGDRHRLCAQMSATARRQAGLVAHGKPGSCPQDLAEAFEVIDSGGGLSGVGTSSLLGVVVAGDRATATLALDDHGRVDVPMVKERGAWRLDSFFGTSPHEAQGASAGDRTSSSPRGLGGAVAVSEAAGGSCFPLFDEDYPDVAGGCALGASGRVTLTIGTALGHFEFGECELSYRLLVDSRGRAWTDSVEFGGPDNVNNGCSDVRGCENADGEPLPWRGRVSATSNGRFVHRMSACLNTCIGSYVGQLAVELAKGRRGWSAVASNSGVGGSGVRFDGRIDFAPGGIELRPAPG